MLLTRSLFLSLFVVGLVATAPAIGQDKPAGNPLNEPIGNPGVIPVGADGQPLNLNFEGGTLDGWTATGKAWEGQPIRGDISTLRPADGKKSEHTGQFWIGGYEKLRDEPTGTLTSPAFEVTHPYASFLIGGGNLRETRVDLVTADDNRVFFTARGKNEENLRPVVVDLTPQKGKKIFIRLVDQSRGGWGHVNFDDFRFHAQRPRFKSTAGDLPVPGVEELYPFAGLSGDEAAKAMVVPPGFSVQCAAEEPDVKQPIAMAIDDRGRIWIAEAYNYPTRGADGEGKDRILIFEDTDLDGKLDKRIVFIEGLNLVSGLEVGFGGVWVGAAPYLLFIPDRDYDDVPDAPPAEYKLPDGLQFPKDVPPGATVLLDGFGWHDTHETLNSFIWGPDGWLYGCHGVFTHSKVGKPGTPDDKREPLNAGIWRYHPVRHEFEVFAHGTSNPWGVDYNQYGDFFATACVIPHLYHIIPGGRYQRQAGQHFNPYTYDDIKTIAEHRHYTGNQWNDDNRRQSDTLGGGHAHAGAMVYQGGAWPEKYHGQLFMNNIHGNRLNVDILTPKGSGYTGTYSPDFLLTRDQASQMLYLTYGPDGQVWVIDWYDMQACHRPEASAHDRTNGRIYRIVYNDAKPVKVDLQKLSNEELVALTWHENAWYERHSRRILQERVADGRVSRAAVLEAIEKVAPPLRPISNGIRDPRNEIVIIKAMFLGDSITSPDDLKTSTSARFGLGGAMVIEEYPRARAWASLGQFDRFFGLRPLNPGLVPVMAPEAQKQTSPMVRLAFAARLQNFPPELRWEILEALTSHPADAADHNLPLMYWYAMEPLADVDPARALALAMTAGENIPLLKEFMIRRIGAGDPARSLALLVEGLKKADDDATRLAFVRGIGEAVKGRRDVPAPADLGKLLKEMAFQPGGSEDLQSRCLSLAVTFGQQDVIDGLRETIRDPNWTAKSKRLAIRIMADHRDVASIAAIRTALASAELRQDALRALAVYDDAQIPPAILSVYTDLSAAERRDALATLASRPAYAGALLDAVAGGKVPANHLTADLVTNLRNLNDDALNKRIETVWGVVRSSPEDVAKQIAAYKQLVESSSSPSSLAPSPSHEVGRAVFAKTCQVCHTLFGTGAKIGPDLTGSNRQNLDYLLSNIVDPSAVMAKEYQPLVVQLEDGRVITGIAKEETADTLTLVTQNESLTVAKSEIMARKQSEKSMMPDNQLALFSPHEIRSLVAYLQAGGQTPLLATPDNVETFFNGENLAGWVGDEKLWSVENGEIVGKTDGLAKNEFLISELSAGDFRLELDVKLVGDEGNSGIQIRSQPIAGGEMKGYQADIGPGWWGKLYEEHGRALLEAKGGEEFVKKGEWNRYEIVAAGSRVRTWINGHLCVDRDDPEGARQGVIGLQLHSGGKTEVRFKNLKLTLLPSHVPALPYPVSKPPAEGQAAEAASPKVSFKKTTLDRAFRSEGVGMGDFNNDGLLDISAGSVWYENPGKGTGNGGQGTGARSQESSALATSTSASHWTMHVLGEKPNRFDIKTYGDTFMNWAEDVDGDGRLDLVVVDFPGKQTWWFQNPGHASKEPWKRHVVVQTTNNESPLFVDVDGDGKRELIFGDGANRLALARPQANPLLEWKETPIAAKADADIQRFYHGLGVGDINKDGRLDVLVPGGWCEAPAEAGGEWTFHAAPFGPAQAQMHVFDFDGDGDNDVVGSSAHQRGLWWYEQDGETWKQHLIDDSIAQTHALVLADVNGDGLPDLVTGKRYYAHNGRDPGEDEAPELAWYELSREADKAATSGRGSPSGRAVPKWTKRLIDSDSGVGTQFEVHDMNADGLLDIVVANKHGVYYFEQTRE